MAAVDKVAIERGPVEADHAKIALSGLYTWLIDRGTVEATPVLKIKSRASGGGRERTLSPSELRMIWKGTEHVCDDYRCIIRLLMLTGSRREEIGGLQWSEVGTDRLELPGSRVKNGRGHLIPLSPLATRQLPIPRDRPNVFGRRTGRTFSGWGKAKIELDRHAKIDHWTPHDLRRTVATMMRELRIADTHLVELILNHVSGTRSGVAGVYDRSERLEERKAALAAWASWIGKNVAR